MVKISELKLRLEEMSNEQEALYKAAATRLGVKRTALNDLIITKKSIDARRRHEIWFHYQILVTCEDAKALRKNRKGVSFEEAPQLLSMTSGDANLRNRPIIIGFGPAGMFAGLLLAKHGYCPLILERGMDVDTRSEQVKRFWESGERDENSNVQFGEGGAGTFSDGKLTARSKDARMAHVLLELIAHGAPQSILCDAHPHIGTDRLKGIVKAIREDIIAHGGEVRFGAKVSDMRTQNGRVSALCVNEEWIRCDQVIMAIGHSARDTFQMLKERDVALEAKPFAVGMRIEHPQSLIDESQYHEFAHDPALGRASYRLTHQASTGKGVYTFCMCPGGYVVPAASNEKQVVVNGMSEYARDGANANSAVLVQVNESDYGSGVFAGMHYQEELEKKAYQLGGGHFHAPVQLAKDYLADRPSTAFGKVRPTYARGTCFAPLKELFSDVINQSLKEGLLAFERKIPGFVSEDALLCAVESRSSSPIRILRDQNHRSLSYPNLYPCGEGAGYAGGIISSAIDGVRCAQKIIETFAPLQERSEKRKEENTKRKRKEYYCR